MNIVKFVHVIHTNNTRNQMEFHIIDNYDNFNSMYTLKLCIEHKSTDLIAFVNAKDFILGEQRRNNPHNARFFCKFYKNE